MIASPAVSYPAAPLTPGMIFAHFKGVAKSILSQRWKYTATETPSLCGRAEFLKCVRVNVLFTNVISVDQTQHRVRP